MRVGLFATCLVDLFRPNVGFAAVKLLEHAGCEVDVPQAQTCCGQPAYNNGDADDARAIARQVIEAFSDCDYVVVPSGSCAGMIKKHYPELFRDDPLWHPRAMDLSERCHELMSFLTDIAHLEAFDATYAGTATYHDSCSSLRECGVKAQPRALLDKVQQLTLAEMEGTEQCCGFGGTFCVKYPEISAKMVDNKLAAIEASGADTLLAGDLGCLLNIAGRLKRRHRPVKVYHVAEVLADMARGPGIGDGESS
jgi:L-lactate dehydrogenase complex protein LldE